MYGGDPWHSGECQKPVAHATEELVTGLLVKGEASHFHPCQEPSPRQDKGKLGSHTEGARSFPLSSTTR